MSRLAIVLIEYPTYIPPVTLASQEAEKSVRTYGFTQGGETVDQDSTGPATGRFIRPWPRSRVGLSAMDLWPDSEHHAQPQELHRGHSLEPMIRQRRSYAIHGAAEASCVGQSRVPIQKALPPSQQAKSGTTHRCGTSVGSVPRKVREGSDSFEHTRPRDQHPASGQYGYPGVCRLDRKQKHALYVATHDDTSCFHLLAYSRSRKHRAILAAPTGSWRGRTEA